MTSVVRIPSRPLLPAWSLVAIAALGLLPLAACGQDLTSAWEVELQVDSDCSQTGSSQVQCVVEGEVLDVVRSGRWIIEDKEGGSLVNPVSSFIVTTDDGRTLSGQHFKNDGSLTDADGNPIATDNCDAQGGGRCYVAQNTTQRFDDESDCFQIETRIADFVIDEEDRLRGSIFEARLTDETCGTRQASQREVKVTATRAEEVVLARKPGAL